MLFDLDSGVGREALLALDSALPCSPKFRGLADFVEHGIVVHCRINAKINLRVRGQKANMLKGRTLSVGA